MVQSRFKEIQSIETNLLFRNPLLVFLLTFLLVLTSVSVWVHVVSFVENYNLWYYVMAGNWQGPWSSTPDIGISPDEGEYLWKTILHLFGALVTLVALVSASRSLYGITTLPWRYSLKAGKPRRYRSIKLYESGLPYSRGFDPGYLEELLDWLDTTGYSWGYRTNAASYVTCKYSGVFDSHANDVTVWIEVPKKNITLFNLRIPKKFMHLQRRR